MKRIVKAVVATTLVGGCIAVVQHASADPAPTTYAVTLLQSPSAGELHVGGLNNKGDVVGYLQQQEATGDGGGVPLLWRAGRSASEEINTGLTTASATDIADDGTMLVNDHLYGTWPHLLINGRSNRIHPGGAEDLSNMLHTSLLSDNGTAALGGVYSKPATVGTDLRATPLPDSSEGAKVLGISPDGSRVVGVDGTSLVVWTDKATTLNLPDGATVSAAGVNDKGEVVACTEQGTTHFTADGTASVLSKTACLPHINNAGTAAGSDGKSALVTMDGAVVELSGLATGGNTLVTVTDINESGQVVGLARTKDGKTVGYIATPQQGGATPKDGKKPAGLPKTGVNA